MRTIRPAVATVALTAVLAGCGYAGTAFLAAAILLAVAGLAAGWGRLLALPHPRGSGAVVALSGVVAVVTAVVSAGRDHPLAPFAVILALSVLAAFGHELLRKDGRPRLVDSVTGTFAGEVLAVLGAGWLLLPGSRTGVNGVAVAAAAVVAARLATALPWPLRITGWIALLGSAAFGGIAAVLLPEFDLWPGALIGACVGVVVAAVDRTLMYQPAARSWPAVAAVAVAPVLAAGTAAYTVARVVLG